jgi:hypothetical protein
MTAPVVCTCGTVHADGCPGTLDICIALGFVFDKTFRLTNRLTGADQDWPVGTSARIRFSGGTGSDETIFAASINGPYLQIDLTADQTEQIPINTRVTIDVNYDSGDPDMWRPWRTGRLSHCR